MTLQFVMRGFNTALNKHVYWSVLATPDFTGAQSGFNPANLTGIVIDYQIDVPISGTGGPIPPGLAGGDLTGTYPNPVIAKLQGKTVTAHSPLDGQVLTWVAGNNDWEPRQPFTVGGPAPVTGQFLEWNGTAWVPAFLPPDTPTGPAGGDLSGTYPNPTVARLQTRAVSATAPQNNFVLTWNAGNNDWEPERTFALTVQPNSFWTQATWYIDPVSGNNTNDGLTSGTPIQTWAEMVRRWGTYSPVISTPVTITFLSDQSANTDPVTANPYFVGTGIITIVGTLQVVATGSLSSVVHKNYSATGAYPNGLLRADLGGAATGHQGHMLINHTRSDAVCWIDSLSGTVATLTQPFVSNVPSYVDLPAEVNSFGNGDSFGVYKPTKVFVNSLQVSSIDTSAIVCFNLSHLWLVDPVSVAATAVNISHVVRVVESRSDVFVNLNDENPLGNSSFVNSWAAAGAYLSCVLVGGAFGTLSQNSLACTVSGITDGDIIIRGAITFSDSKNTGFTQNSILSTYLDNSAVISQTNVTRVCGDTLFGSSLTYPDGYIYGQYTLALDQASNQIVYAGSAADTFNGTPTFQISGSSFANAYDRSVNPGTWHPGRAITVANLDTAVSQGGFGGTAIGDNGATIALNRQTGAVPNFLLQTAWFIDPQSGSDLNDGLTSLTPIRTWAELLRRWGSEFPVLTVAVTVTFLTDQLTTTDPVRVSPTFTGSGALTITGTLALVASGSLSGVVAKNYNATGNYPSGLLQADLGGAAAGHQGYLLVNTNQGNAPCWIDSLSGTVAALTQPFVPNVPTYNDGPNEVNAFTNGDSFSIYKPTKVYVEDVRVTASTGAAINLSHLWLIDASGTPGTTIVSLSHFVRCTEVRIDCSVQYTDTFLPFNNACINSWVGAGGEFIGCIIVGGSFGTLTQSSGGSVFSGLLDGDVIIRGANNIVGGSSSGFTENFLGAIYIDNSTGLSFSNETGIASDTVFQPVYDGYVHGKYVLNLIDTSCKVTFLPKHGSLVGDILKGNPTLRINSASFANAYDASVDPGVWHPGRSLTVANLDTPISQGGFGGLAVGDGGATFTLRQQRSTPTNYQQQSALFIDPQNGSDLNDGISSGTPIKTWAELTRRWGTVSPILGQDTVITFLSSQTDSSDPIVFTPFIRNGAIVQLVGVLNITNQVSSGILTGTIQRNRATSQLFETTLFSVPSTGWLVHFTTNDSYSWVYKAPGGNVAVLSQPTFSSDFLFSGSGLPVDPISNLAAQAVIHDGYTYIAYTPIQVNLVQVAVQSVSDFGVENSAGFNLAIRKLAGFDPANPSPFFGINIAQFDKYVSLWESSQAKIIAQDLHGFTVYHNCWLQGGANLASARLSGGILSGGGSLQGTLKEGVDLENDLILNNNLGVPHNYLVTANGSSPTIGTVYVDGYSTLDILSDANDLPGLGYAGGTVVWGPGTLNVSQGSFTYTPPATSTFLVANLEINGTGFANAYDRSVDPGVWHPGRAITAAHLDASVFSGGFGGLAIGDNGGVISAGSQRSAASTNFNFFVDPSNVSGLANDNNSGLSSSTPLLTTARLNTLLFRRRLTADTTITYMSDDFGLISLDYSTMDFVTFNLTFQGTPQVLHTGGTLNAGTVAIAPLLNQRQVVHTSDLATFIPYIIPSLGGTAAHPTLLVDTTGGNNGTSAWIVSCNNHDVSDGYMSRPIATDGTAGTLTITNNYKIVRGSILNVVQGPIQVHSSGTGGGGVAFFNDFAFGTTHWGIEAGVYTRCSFDNVISAGGGFTNCFMATGIVQLSSIGGISLTAGALVTTPFDELISPITLQGDVYVTGDSFILSTDSYANVFLTPGSDGYGAQFQDLTSQDGAIQVYTTTGFGCGIVDAAGGADALIWGTNNAGPGIAIGPGATLSVAGGDHIADPRSTPPIITGAGGDFVFIDGLGIRVATGRSWNETVNKYNAPAATTWANFTNPNVFNFQVHNVATDASIVAIPRALGPAGPAREALGPIRFIDPSNVTTLASDSNDGATSTTPILTTAHLNDLLFQRQISTSVTITYLSDDTSGTFLDLSTVLVTATGSLKFKGTPQVLHTGGTLNSGTIAINPLASGGGQRQTAHTSDLAAFAPYVLTSLGGTADHPTYIIDTTGGNTGNSAWIVSGLGATASLSRPMDTTFLATGALTIGDSYKIQRGSLLAIGGSLTVGFAPGAIVFTDFAFTSNGLRTPGSFLPTYNRCSADAILFSSGFFAHCFAANDLDFSSPGYLLWAGVWLLTGGNTGEALVELAADVYVRDTPGFAQAIRCDQNGQGNIAVFEGAGSGGLGAQFQDISHPTAALIICSSPIICTGSNGDGLIWGNGNDGYGIAIAPNGLATVPSNGVFTPNITGALGDFCFLGQNGGVPVTVARAWDESIGAYTEAGGPATRTTTWAHFVAALGSSGFNFQAHNPATNGHIVGI